MCAEKLQFMYLCLQLPVLCSFGNSQPFGAICDSHPDSVQIQRFACNAKCNCWRATTAMKWIQLHILLLFRLLLNLFSCSRSLALLFALSLFLSINTDYILELLCISVSVSLLLPYKRMEEAFINLQHIAEADMHIECEWQFSVCSCV